MNRSISFISRILIVFFFLFSLFSCGKDAEIKNNDASLNEIFINSELIENFNSEKFNYEFTVEFGTSTIPEVTAVATDANAQVFITQVIEIPGVAVINILSEDGTTSRIYLINFKETIPSTDATLKSIKIHGIELDGFSADQTEYQIELLEGATSAPTVSATTNDENATILITQASELPGMATILVSAQDAQITKEYSITFTVESNGFENIAEILTAQEAWLCTAYEELISGDSDSAPEGSMFFVASYSITGDCMFSYGPNPEDQYESTWEVDESNTKIIYDKGTEFEYTTTILEITQNLFKYNDAYTSSQGTDVDYIFTLEPSTDKSFNKIISNTNFKKR